MKKAKKLIVTLLAACMMIAGASASVFAAGTDSLVKFTPDRYAGSTRYETSIKLADALKDSLGVDAFDNIIVAYGGNYPDALAGGYLAKVENAPVITVDKKAASENTVVKYIENNLKAGGTVYILGGENAVTKRFETAAKKVAKVERIAGATRYATNLAILKAAGVTDEELIICSGNGYADSLSASAVGRPILLVNKTLTADQKKAISNTKKAYIIGGTSAVSASIEKQVKALAPETKRIAGTTRYATSTAVATEFFGKDIEAITLAYGKNFPDGLSGGPVAMSLGAPLILTETANHKDAKTYRQSTGAYLCATFGGTALISDEAVFDIMYNYITTKELKADPSKYVIIDARKIADFEKSHIPGAVSADVDSAIQAKDNTNETAVANIKAIVDANDADTQYVIVCYSGNKYARSATTIMAELGVDPANILTLKGGFGQWTKDYPNDVTFDYQYVNAEDVFAAMTDKNIVILDARKAADYATAHIPGAVSADCDSIVSKSQAEPATTNLKNVVTKYGADKKYYVICYSGNKYAKNATDILVEQGVNANNIYTLGGDDRAVSSNGGMKAWNAKYPNYVVKTYTSTGGFNFMNGITPANLNADVTGAKKFTVVDLRTTDVFVAGHIPGAVSAVQRDVTAEEAKANLEAMLQKNPDGKYVLVCYSGNKFADQARNTLVNELGVDEKDVIILEGGFGAWTGTQEKGNGNYVNADDVFAAITDKNVVILDTRKAADFATAHIPGAVSADCDSIVSKNEAEPATANINAVVDKYGTDKKYYVICYSGNKYAQNATDLLLAKGVNTNNIYTLGGDDRKISSNGGMKAWNAKYANYVVKTYTSTGGFNFMNGITAANLKADVNGEGIFTVVDLRTADLYKAGHIPGAVSAVQRDVTDDEAKANLQKVVTAKPDAKYVLVCYSGNSFANKARNTLVNDLGIDEKDVIILEGGQAAWTYPTATITIDKKAGTATFYVTANSKFTDGTGEAISHLITSSISNEGQKGNALFDTKTAPLELYDALESLGGVAWSSTKSTQFANGKKLRDQGVKNSADTENYSKLTVLVYDGDTLLGEIRDVVKYQKNGVAQGMPNVSMAFSGNKVNQKAWNTGCVACLFSCYAGVTSNENIGIGTCTKDKNYFYADTTKLQPNHEYKIVYSIKPAPEYTYVNADDVFKAINNQDVVILDTRKVADYKTAHIPGAVSASCDTEVSGNTSVDKDAAENINNVVVKYGADKKYYVICYSGNRYAKEATQLLINAGVANDNIKTLGGDDRQISSNGGMKAWNASYPNYVVKTYKSSGGFDFMNGITVDNLKADVAVVEQGKSVFTVIDLRTADLYEAAHIPGAVSAVQRDVTADEAKANLEAVVNAYPGQKYVLVCYSGNKFADQARNTLVNDLGVDEKDVIVLDGGQGAWNGDTQTSVAATKSGVMTVNIDLSTGQYNGQKTAKVWVPIPQSDSMQTIANVQFDAESATTAQITTDSEGNKTLYIEWDESVAPADRKATVSYHVVRKSNVKPNFKEHGTINPTEFAAELAEFETSGSLTSGVVKETADSIVQEAGAETVLEKAWAIYEWEVMNLHRINEQVGCGNGDVSYILTTSKGGKCTDLNSTFVALCRAEGIPAREKFGCRLNANATGGEHCRAEFYCPGIGWVEADPADTLKAMLGKEAEMRADAAQMAALYKKYWGANDENWVQLSSGRDLTLSPAQSASCDASEKCLINPSGTLNNIGYIYGEYDGQYMQTYKPAQFGYTMAFVVD